MKITKDFYERNKYSKLKLFNTSGDAYECKLICENHRFISNDSIVMINRSEYPNEFLEILRSFGVDIYNVDYEWLVRYDYDYSKGIF